MYSTGQSTDAAYIIGGTYAENIIAEFKNDQWSRLGDLKQPRYNHGSITIGTKTMVVGGITSSDKLVSRRDGHITCRM